MRPKIVTGAPLDKIAPNTKEGLESFCHRWKVAELAVFGSVVKNDFGPGSDIDLLVTFTPEADWGLLDHVKMEQELTTLFDRNVDLVSRRAIERSQNWIRRKNILGSAQVIYAV